MKGARFLLGAVMLGTLLCQGCTFVRIAYAVERQRLQDLRCWEARLAQMNCAALTTEYEKIEGEREQLVDFDQRQQTMRHEMQEKSCPLPNDLS